MAANDYAILVGISRYADPALNKLEGPVRDVKLLHGWLMSPDGGALPDANIKEIVSDEATQAAAIMADEMPPLFQDFLDVFLRLVRRPDKSGYIRRPDSRLYLYFSGHGFCEKQTNVPHAALYVANADRDVNWNIYGTWFAQWARDHGLFGEIVLIMDCCRDAELAKQPLVPPLRKSTDTGVAHSVKLFEVYAAPRGGKAQERLIASRGNGVHGLLTHAFIEAIQHAAPDMLAVSAEAIKNYLEERWIALCGDQPADPPEVIVPSHGKMLFSRGKAKELPQRIKLVSLKPGSTFELLGANHQVFAQVDIDETNARVTRDGATLPHLIENGVLTLSLPVSYYTAIAATPAGLLRKLFQAGDRNVEL